MKNQVPLPVSWPVCVWVWLTSNLPPPRLSRPGPSQHRRLGGGVMRAIPQAPTITPAEWRGQLESWASRPQGQTSQRSWLLLVWHQLSHRTRKPWPGERKRSEPTFNHDNTRCDGLFDQKLCAVYIYCILTYIKKREKKNKTRPSHSWGARPK